VVSDTRAVASQRSVRRISLELRGAREAPQVTVMRSKPRHGTSFYGQQPRVPKPRIVALPLLVPRDGTALSRPLFRTFRPEAPGGLRVPAARMYSAGYSGKHFRPAFCLRHSRMTSEKSVCLSATSSGSCYWPPWWWRSSACRCSCPAATPLHHCQRLDPDRAPAYSHRCFLSQSAPLPLPQSPHPAVLDADDRRDPVLAHLSGNVELLRGGAPAGMFRIPSLEMSCFSCTWCR